MPVTPAALARSRFKSTALSVCTFLYWCDSVRGGSESIDGILPHKLPCLSVFQKGQPARLVGERMFLHVVLIMPER